VSGIRPLPECTARLRRTPPRRAATGREWLPEARGRPHERSGLSEGARHWQVRSPWEASEGTGKAHKRLNSRRKAGPNSLFRLRA
jgi:hypothetical protein